MSAETTTDFTSLRVQAVGFAQAASGNIWTDFNLHDPGVTLLEQTCFALSEIAYQAAHPIRDLLTGDDDHLDHPAMALYDPRDVLPVDPVTDSDLSAYLSDMPEVSAVWVTPHGRDGLYDATVITADCAENLPADALRKLVQDRFAARRPLGTDLAQVTVARKRDTILTGTLHISASANPERVAARFYFRVGAILRRQSDQARARSARREDVYARPELFMRPPADPGEGMPDIDAHLTALKTIPGIVDIGDLSFREVSPSSPEDALLPTFPSLALPQTRDEIELVLKIGDNALALDHNRIHEEFIRVSAEGISRAHHHLDDADWSVLKDGRRRNFARAPVDDMLPAIYRIYSQSMQAVAYQDERRPTSEAGFFAQYRGAIDAHLSGMSAALADIPSLFDAETGQGTDDPVEYRRRIEVLDLLLALHGETLPAIRHTGVHHYRSVAERQDFELKWRLHYLRALPALNAARGTGPSTNRPGGFLARLGALADLNVQTEQLAVAQRADRGFLVDATTTPPEPQIARRDLLLPVNPFDMLVPRNSDVEPLDREALTRVTPWQTEGSIPPELFLRAADPTAFSLTPIIGGRWQILFDGGHKDALYALDESNDKAEAIVLTNRIRASWRLLHEQAEKAYLVEDILQRAEGSAFRAHHCWLVLTGWTARMGRGSYRNYVSDLVQQIAPAHIVIDLLWLDMSQMAQFEKLRGAATDDLSQCAPLREFLSALEGQT